MVTNSSVHTVDFMDTRCWRRRNQLASICVAQPNDCCVHECVHFVFVLRYRAQRQVFNCCRVLATGWFPETCRSRLMCYRFAPNGRSYQMTHEGYTDHRLVLHTLWFLTKRRGTLEHVSETSPLAQSSMGGNFIDRQNFRIEHWNH